MNESNLLRPNEKKMKLNKRCFLSDLPSPPLGGAPPLTLTAVRPC